MTKLNFQPGDTIGRFVLEDFAGQKTTTGEGVWWVTENGESKRVSETQLRRELARTEWTPEKIHALSSKAYDELVKKIGSEAINEIMSGSSQQPTTPPNFNAREIAEKWFLAHKQIPLTKANSKLFDEYLAKMANPSFTSKDFDLAFGELFTKLELNPQAAGIEGHGEAVRGEAAIQRLTASQVQQLQKSFPVVTRTKNLDRTNIDDVIVEIGEQSPTADAFLKNLKTVDRELGVPEQIPPLLMEDRRQLWASFFQLHPSVEPTNELQEAVLTICADTKMPITLQSFDTALDLLVQAGDPVVTRQESSVKTYNGARLVTGNPRPRNPMPSYDPSEPVNITIAEINSMDSKTYSQKSLNPKFREAVDRLMERVGAR